MASLEDYSEGAPADTRANQEVVSQNSTIPRASQISQLSQLTRSTGFIALGAATLLIATILRFWSLPSRPGLEWDEPIYYSVASSLFISNELKAKGPIGIDEPFLYHPPFYFYFLAYLFDSAGQSIGTARIGSSVASILLFFSLYVLMRDQLNRQDTLLLMIILVTDAWIVYTNRIAFFENAMMILLVLGLLYYQLGFRGEFGRSQRFFIYILAGSLMGIAGIFKHTGLYVLLVIPIHWILIRRHSWEHLTTLASAGILIAIYLLGMTYVYGDVFISQFLIQVNRAIGIYPSRGIISIQDAFTAAIGSYSIFAGTIITTIAALAYVAAKMITTIRERSLASLRVGTSLYFAWTLAAIISFGFVNLKFPQYFMLTLLPLYCYVGADLFQNVRKDHPERYSWLVILLGLLVVINLGGFIARFVTQEDQAIANAVSYAESSIPEDAIIATDEPIGVLIPQRYLRIDDWQLWIERLPPSYIITYITQTQELPESQQLGELISSSKEIQRFSGFKEEIVIYEVPP